MADKQTAANRRNAERSTGPDLYALKSGIYAESLLPADENPDDLPAEWLPHCGLRIQFLHSPTNGNHSRNAGNGFVPKNYPHTRRTTPPRPVATAVLPLTGPPTNPGGASFPQNVKD